MMKDIYTIERRADLRETCIRIDRYIKSNKISWYGVDFYKHVNDEIKYYDKNLGALNLKEYMEDIGLDISKIPDANYSISDEKCLLYIQFVVVFTDFLYEWLGKASNDIKRSIGNWAKPLFEMIDYRLELSNYKRMYFEDKNEHFLVKRDVDVDSVINDVTDNDVQLLLLQYLDFRTAKDLDAKKFILTRLFIYYEDPKSNLKISNNKLKSIVKRNQSYKDILPIVSFSEICESFEVRHFPNAIKKDSSLIPLGKEETHVLCDIAFYMFIEAIRIPKIHEMRVELSKYKKHYKIEDSYVEEE